MRRRAKRGEARPFLENIPTDIDECILWPFAVAPNGYGFVGAKPASRESLKFHVGPPPPAPEGETMQAAHSCREKTCINPNHLSWKTGSENAHDKVRDGTDNRGERHGKAKLTNEQVLDIRKRLATTGTTQTQLAKEFGVSIATVSFLHRRVTWSHI